MRSADAALLTRVHQGRSIGPRSWFSQGRVVRFSVYINVLSFLAVALCSCSSPSIPPWAAATLKSQYRAEMRMADTSRERRSHIARPTMGEAQTENVEVANHKAYEEVASIGSVPVKFQYLKP